MPPSVSRFFHTSRLLLLLGSRIVVSKSFLRLIVWDLFFFGVIYITLSAIYHFALDAAGRKNIEQLSDTFMRYKLSATIEFVLGLFMGRVVVRYLAAFKQLPFPDSLAFLCESYIRDPLPESKEKCEQPNQQPDNSLPKSKHYRATIFRYVCCGMILAMTRFSQRVRQRFPNVRSLKKRYNLLTDDELALMELIGPDVETKSHFKMSNCYFARPFTWCMCLIKAARSAGLINTDSQAASLKDEVSKIASMLSSVLDAFLMPQISFSLIQVVLICVYVYLALIAFRLSTVTDLFDFSPNAAPSPLLRNELSKLIPRGPFLANNSTQADVVPAVEFDLTTVLFCRIISFLTFILQIAVYLGIARISCALLWTYNGPSSSVDANRIIDRNLQFLDMFQHDILVPTGDDIFDENLCDSVISNSRPLYDGHDPGDIAPDSGTELFSSDVVF